MHRLRKYLGAYLLHFEDDLHAVVFSAGIGENSAVIRSMMLAGLEVGPVQPCTCSYIILDHLRWSAYYSSNTFHMAA